MTRSELKRLSENELEATLANILRLRFGTLDASQQSRALFSVTCVASYLGLSFGFVQTLLRRHWHR